MDCAALKFWVGTITDDASCATLGALLMQVCSPGFFVVRLMVTIGLSCIVRLTLFLLVLIGISEGNNL